MAQFVYSAANASGFRQPTEYGSKRFRNSALLIFSMHEIFVDADACPVKEEIFKVAYRHGWQTHVVSNSWMRLPETPLINRIVVSEGLDAADDWIAERAGKSDLVITNDIPLASRCLNSGARALRPTGKVFTEDNIGMGIAMRNLSAHLRDVGEITGGPSPFNKKDRSRFLSAMEEIIQSIKRTI